VFRRRRREDDELLDDELDAEDGAGPDEEPAPAAPARPEGPWDADDAPDDDAQRLDLGGLLVPVPEGMEVRVEVSPEGEVVAATLVRGGSAMQINAFAAPRKEGIWGEVRAEIVGSLRGSGGAAEETEGPFGTELRARVPTEVAGQGHVVQPARFLGVDGPRRFLRALVTGPAATDPVQAAALETAFRSVVVVRGKEAMAPRDPLPLRLPKDVTETGAHAEQAASLDPFERGPEITEVR